MLADIVPGSEEQKTRPIDHLRRSTAVRASDRNQHNSSEDEQIAVTITGTDPTISKQNGPGDKCAHNDKQKDEIGVETAPNRYIVAPSAASASKAKGNSQSPNNNH